MEKSKASRSINFVARAVLIGTLVVGAALLATAWQRAREESRSTHALATYLESAPSSAPTMQCRTVPIRRRRTNR